MAVRDRMKARREQTLNWGLKEAALRTGVDYQYLWKLERGENIPPGWELLRKIAEGYETSADWLLERTDDPSPPSQDALIYSARAGVYLPASSPLAGAGEELLALLPSLQPSRMQDLISIAAAFVERDNASERGTAPGRDSAAEHDGAGDAVHKDGSAETEETNEADSEEERIRDQKLNRFYLNIIEAGGGPEAIDELLDALEAPGGPDVARARLLRWFRNHFPDE